MMKVEKASVQDARFFSQLEEAPDTREYIFPSPETEHARNILDPRFVYLRILNAGQLIGFFVLVLDFDQTSIEFRRVVVSEKGKGIGQTAIVAMEDFCRSELQRTRIWLDVFEHNTRGRYIYEKLRYERYGERDHERGKLLLYQKKL